MNTDYKVGDFIYNADIYDGLNITIVIGLHVDMLVCRHAGMLIYHHAFQRLLGLPSETTDTNTVVFSFRPCIILDNNALRTFVAPNSSQISHSVMAVAPISLGREILPCPSIVIMFLFSFIGILFLIIWLYRSADILLHIL